MKIVLLIMIAVFVLAQAIRPTLSNPAVDDAVALHAPQEVEQILKTSCYDCHSNETIWPTYAQIAPLSWVMAGHVNDGRKALNFSNWENIDKDIKIKRLKRAIQTVNNGMMPLSSYLNLHENAKMSESQKATIVNWCKEELAH